MSSPKLQAFTAARSGAPAAPAPAIAQAVTSDIDAPSRRGAERPDDFALVIGIEEYQSVPKADYGACDAKTVRRHLEALGFPSRNIISLVGAEATGSGRLDENSNAAGGSALSTGDGEIPTNRIESRTAGSRRRSATRLSILFVVKPTAFSSREAKSASSMNAWRITTPSRCSRPSRSISRMIGYLRTARAARMRR